jgi:hypothetical protein
MTSPQRVREREAGPSGTIYGKGRKTPSRVNVHAPGHAKVTTGKRQRTEGASRDYAAKRRPSFSAVAWRVFNRHRSMASRRATATTALRRARPSRAAVSFCSGG